jgi:hypothetical protein
MHAVSDSLFAPAAIRASNSMIAVPTCDMHNVILARCCVMQSQYCVML